MAHHELTGLDPSNPLGFLAALGLLKVLCWHARRDEAPPTLHFAGSGIGFPVLSTPLSLNEVRDAVLADAVAEGNCRALQLAYDKDGLRVAHTAPGAVRDLKPTPAEARAFLDWMSRSEPRSAGMAAGYFSELAHANDGRTKPTALHFTSGQQPFLGMLDELRLGITGDDIDEALKGPWQGKSRLPSMSWDSSATRYYALRATDPSPEKRGSVPAANWLAFQALSFFPVAASRGRLRTTAVTGSWKTSTFVWPLWAEPLPSRVIASLVRTNVSGMTRHERVALGITHVLSSSIQRSDPGGYGSFAPADVVPPAASTQ
jgi:hypothetical protein